MSDSPSVDLSVIFATPHGYPVIRATIGYLRRQTIRRRMEIVMVVSRSARFRADPDDLADFAGYQVVEIDEIRSTAAGYQTGIEHARAPVVVMAEDHSFPDPNWAEALVHRHGEAWAAVGPVLRNANPRTVVSWADFLIAYGPWTHPQSGGEFPHLPGHNSSYKRDILLAYGPDLAAMMAAESVLHWDLRRRGFRLFLEPAARTAHINFAELGPWLKVQFYSARVFGAARVHQQSLGRRCLFAAGAPLTLPIRFGRILRHWSRYRRLPGLRRGVLPMIGLGLSVRALGEMVGYATGAGSTRRKLFELESHRLRFAGEHFQPYSLPS